MKSAPYKVDFQPAKGLNKGFLLFFLCEQGNPVVVFGP
jgi:hypothetical protein